MPDRKWIKAKERKVFIVELMSGHCFTHNVDSFMDEPSFIVINDIDTDSNHLYVWHNIKRIIMKK